MLPLYDEQRKKGIPFVTIALIVLNIYFFYIISSNPDYYFNNYGFSFSDLFDGRLFTVFTSMFLHANVIHLLGNILFLWVFGKNIEAKTGSLRFLLFYFLCGIFAILAYALVGTRGSIVIGASGAISGVLGAYLILFPRNKIKAIVPIIVFWTVASIPAFVFIIIWFLLQLFSLGAPDMVAYSSHVGGFIAGMLLIKSFAKKR